MADAVKQRLIGALLVLLIIIIAAFILVRNANDNVEGQQQLVLPEPNATIDTVDDNIIMTDQEVLLDPHQLGEDVVAVTKGQQIEQTLPPSTPVGQTVPAQESVEKVVQVTAVEPIKPKPSVVEKIDQPATIQSQTVTPKPKVNSPSQPQWLIQIASFGVHDNVLALQQKVMTLGYQSTIQAVQTSQGKTVYRLKIGPESDKKTVDNIVSKVKQHLHLSPQVIKQ